ncbi:MAG: 2-amino-4-hydroxy-6-hydroxymethyldihydropteridine diphosphokinase [Gaiella sp.]
MTRAFVGLGANLGDRRATLSRAVELLDALADVEVLAVSDLRETEPWGPVAQPPFLNGAVELETALSARALLDALLALERALGRRRDGEERWGPRTVDLDLLVFGDEVIDEDGLRVPHPLLHERAFALYPLAELDPGLVIPGRGPVGALLGALDG